jgi:hypothetical protein
MFSRLQEALRILTYHEPHDGSDAVIVERKTTVPSRPGIVISHVLEFFIVVYVLSNVAGRIVERLLKIVPATHSVSLSTLAGAVGVVLAFVLHSVRDDIEKKLKAHLNLSEVLAPYFGHRLDYTIRVLKG